MRTLFDLDAKNYAPEAPVFRRDSARCINIRDGRVAMVHSLKYDYYKFPGGGIEPGESHEAAAIRETLEEAGLAVIPGSIREYGCVHRKERGQRGDTFVQDNFYYLCDVEAEVRPQELDGYEEDERFTLEYVEPELAIEVNRFRDHGPKPQQMLEREARVLEMLVDEGYFKQA